MAPAGVQNKTFAFGVALVVLLRAPAILNAGSLAGMVVQLGISITGGAFGVALGLWLGSRGGGGGGLPLPGSSQSGR